MQKKTLLYYETAGRIREYIVAEKLHTGAFLPTERVLAEEFGVSVVTLKRALKVLCEKNILTTIPRRGTKVNALPEAAGSACKKKRIGLAVWRDSDIFHTDAIRLISAAGTVFPQSDYEIVLVYVTNEMLYAESWGDSLSSSCLDGLLVCVQELQGEMLKEIKTSSLPTVFLAHKGFSPGVWINEAPGISKLLKYLVSLGHERIAFVSGPADLGMVQDQVKAFKNFVCGRNIPFDNKYIASSLYERKAAFIETIRLLELPEPPTAILAGSEFMAQGVLDALQSKGKKCPGDLSLACFGGISISQQSYPQLTILTTIFDQNPGTFSAGAQMLRDILEGRTTETSVIVERELIVRESTSR